MLRRKAIWVDQDLTPGDVVDVVQVVVANCGHGSLVIDGLIPGDRRLVVDFLQEADFEDTYILDQIYPAEFTICVHKYRGAVEFISIHAAGYNGPVATIR